MDIRDFISKSYNPGDDEPEHFCERCEKIKEIIKKLSPEDGEFIDEMYN